MYRARSLLGQGTFGRVYDVSTTVPVPELVDEGVTYVQTGLVMKEGYVDDWADVVKAGMGVQGDGGKGIMGRIAHPREVAGWAAFSGTIVPQFHGTTFVLDDGATASPPPPVATKTDGMGGGAGMRGGTSPVLSEEEGEEDAPPPPCIRMLSVIERFGRSLFDHMYSARGMEEGCVLEVCRQVLTHLAVMHGAGYMHRDLKPHNILIDDTVFGFPLVRLCDLGACKNVAKYEAAATTGRPARHSPYHVARYYRAPELLCGSTSYGYAADVWAVAVTLAEMASAAYATRNRTLTHIQYRGAGGRHTTFASMPPGPEREAFKVNHMRTCSTLFNGASNDGAQLLHIINLCGVPTEQDVAAMQLHPTCEARLRALLGIVAGHAANQPGLVVGAVPAPPFTGVDGRRIQFTAPPRREKWTFAPHHPARSSSLTTAATVPAVGTVDFPATTAANSRVDAGAQARAPPAGDCGIALSPLGAPPTLGVGREDVADGAVTVGVPSPRRLTAGEGSSRTGLDNVRIPPLPVAGVLRGMGVPAGLSECLAAMLTWNPGTRLTAAQALQHPGLTGSLYLPPGLPV